jgi:hypothetical protein
VDLFGTPIIYINTEKFVIVCIVLKVSQTRLKITRGEKVWLYVVC